MSRHLPRTGLLVPVLALAAACADNPAAPVLSPPADARRAALECRASVRARTVECAPASRGPRANLIIGGQGVYVRVATSNIEWSPSDSYFAADFTLQNLLDQPLGTDGTGTYGAKVFFHSGPTASAGFGAVTVMNPDGTGTFTAGGQPYFEYPGVIEPRGISPAKRWEFELPATVETFVFTLYVETQVPAEPSVLKWKLENGTPTYLGTIWSLWAAAPHNVFAAGDYGTVLHYDGNHWRALSTGQQNTLYGIWGAAANRVWAVGEFGTILTWDGTDWTASEDPDLGLDDFYAVWGTSDSDVWAVGINGRIVHWDGSDWQDFSDENLTTEDLNAVWGAAADDVWIVGGGGSILHWDGAAWASVPNPTPESALYSVRGTSSTDVWAVGCGCGTEGGVALHWDGAEWTASTDPEITEGGMSAVWAAAPDDVWAAGPGTLLHYDGSDWTVEQGGLDEALVAVFGTSAGNVFVGGFPGFIERYDGVEWREMTFTQPTLNAVWAAPGGVAWAVGDFGSILYRDGSAWTADEGASGPDLFGVWGASTTDVWAVGDAGTLLHYDGAEWTPETPVTTERLAGVWGSGPADVVAVGAAGTILRYGGAGWSAETSGTTEDLNAVWGTSASHAIAVGGGGAVVRWNGLAWAPMVSGTTENLFGVWGSGPADVYAVGANGTVLHYDGNVAGLWEAVSTPAPPGAAVQAVWGSAADDVFVLANDGLDVLRWDGAAWKTMTAFSPDGAIWYYALTGTGAHDLYAVGDLGAIIHGTR